MTRRTAGVVAVLLALATLVGGCSGPSAQADRAGMLAALSVIEGAGFHEMNERLTGASPTIDPAYPGRVRHARIAAAAASWPPEVQKKAQAFTAAADILAAAIEKDDLAAASKASTDAHAAYHALSDAGWEVLGDNAGVGRRAH